MIVGVVLLFLLAFILFAIACVKNKKRKKMAVSDRSSQMQRLV